MAFLRHPSFRDKPWRVRSLALALGICLPLLTIGCSRILPLQVKNHYNFPIEVYNASFVAPVAPVLLGTALPNSTLDAGIGRITDGEIYHIRICKMSGALLRDIKTPTDKVNASFDNRHGKWQIDVKP